jgi:hypothetical protein
VRDPLSLESRVVGDGLERAHVTTTETEKPPGGSR